MNFNTPILLNVFNRPEHTKKVIRSLRKVQPSYLFINADGPRENNSDDELLCKQVRELLSEIDWNCTTKTRFLEKNLGVRDSPKTGIDWFFSYVEEGIILEDDIIADESFFYFCQELLEKYRHDDKIMHIGGYNPVTNLDLKISYIFTRYPTSWGFATWKRSWNKYELNFPNLKSQYEDKKSNLNQIDSEQSIIDYLTITFNKTKLNEIKAWDYQWFYSIIINDGYAITFSNNLIQNIGFGKDSTNTKSSIIPFLHLKPATEVKPLMFPLTHPSVVFVNKIIERKIFYSSHKEKFKLFLRRIFPFLWKKDFSYLNNLED
jgi:hypothetical protein